VCTGGARGKRDRAKLGVSKKPAHQKPRKTKRKKIEKKGLIGKKKSPVGWELPRHTKKGRQLKLIRVGGGGVERLEKGMFQNRAKKKEP